MRRISVLRVSVIYISPYELTRFPVFTLNKRAGTGRAYWGGKMKDEPSLKNCLCPLAAWWGEGSLSPSYPCFNPIQQMGTP